MMRTAPTDPSSSSEPVWSANDLSEDPHAAPDKASRVQRMFAAIAGSYDLNNRLHSFGRDQAWRRAAVRLAEVKPDDHVLDVACGTGDLTEAFVRAKPAAVVGVDFTAPMLDIARRKAGRLQRSSGAPTPRYDQGDATRLQYDDGSFDIVSIAFGIRNVDEPPRALAEFRRVLRPGGRLVILEFSQPRLEPLRSLSRFYTDRIMPLTASWIARDQTGAYRYLPKSVDTFHRPDELIGLLHDAGFTAVSTRRLTFGVCTAYLARVAEAPAADSVR
jgi:demethylmenaquinone methyltransferase/2-methoxy-6-polyprenyl-1,4-benzoquinol methylase